MIEGGGSSPEVSRSTDMGLEAADAARMAAVENFVRSQEAATNRYAQNERSRTFNSLYYPGQFEDASMDTSIDGAGHDLITAWMGGQMAPYGATHIDQYALRATIEAFSLRNANASLDKRAEGRVRKQLYNLSELTKKDVEGHDSGLSDKEKEDKKVLVSAIAKERLIEVKNRLVDEQNNKKGKGREMVSERMSETDKLTVPEAEAWYGFDTRVKTIEMECRLCAGEIKEAMKARTDCRVEIIKDEILLRSGLLNESKPGHKDIIKRVMMQKDLRENSEDRLVNRMIAAGNILQKSIDDNKADEWIKFTSAIVGANSITEGNAVQMENDSDLEPIGRLWENQGRIPEMHPGNLVEMVKRWPSFEEGFRALSAIASGKYALGSNGEIYPTGAYGLGYVVTKDKLAIVEKDKNGKEINVTYKKGDIVDVDKAFKSNSGGRNKENLVDGITRLNENQIWIPDKGVVDITFKVDIEKENDDGSITTENVKIELNKDGFWVRSDRVEGDEDYIYSKYYWKGWNTEIDVDGKPVKIFSKNILYESKSTNKEVSNFMNGIKEFVTGFERGKGKEPFDKGVNFGVELARNYFEMSMLSSWYGVPRDSKGKPYYGLYKLYPLEDGKLAPKREMLDMWKISSDPENRAVKRGIVILGWDEGSLFPYHVNDWGKLTLTRLKQMSEIFKGRKHGLYPLMPYLPESLAQPMLSDETIRGVIKGDSKYSLERIFGKMGSVEKLKTFWLGIAKGISVYEFISSTFIGDKEPLKAGGELIAWMMNPKNFEALNKSIDLSLLYVDDWEAARLRVNIVTAAFAAVAQEFSKDEFTVLGPQGVANKGKIAFFDIKEKDLLDATKEDDEFIGALKQLVASRFVGDAQDVIKILRKITTSWKGESDICFSMKEFKAIFGEDYLKKVWTFREKRREKVSKGKSKINQQGQEID